MSKHPSADQAVELLEKLKKTVRDFAEREEKLNHDFRLRGARMRQHRDELIEQQQTRLNEQLAQAEAEFEAAKAHNQSSFRARKIRIAEAHKASKKGALARIEDKEGRRKHKLQTETLQSERNRDTGLANNETAWMDFKALFTQ